MISSSHIVPEETPQIRLSDYARTAFPLLASRKGAQKAIKRGAISIDGTVGKTSDWIRPGQTLLFEEPFIPPPKIYRFPLEVIFEDTHLALINKPAGIEVSGNKFKTVSSALPFNLTPSTEPDFLSVPRPVHRIDYSTSGLLLVAKTTAALIHLSQQFESKTIQKRYRAIIMGSPQKNEGTIETPINNQTAQSEYRVLKTIPSLKSGTLSLVDLFPHTGRTHQLRIHLAHIGHPIVGDQKYGNPSHTLKGKGLFLSAVELHFTHPVTQQQKNINLSPPKKFTTYLQREENWWNRFNGKDI